jgi:hypothetical protein
MGVRSQGLTAFSPGGMHFRYQFDSRVIRVGVDESETEEFLRNLRFSQWYMTMLNSSGKLRRVDW